jgi:hypothetical protein
VAKVAFDSLKGHLGMSATDFQAQARDGNIGIRRRENFFDGRFNKLANVARWFSFPLLKDP